VRYQEAMSVYYNTARDRCRRQLSRQERKTLSRRSPVLGKFFFKPASGEYPVYKTRYCKLASISATTGIPGRLAPLALNVPNISSNPSATVAGLSEHLGN